MSLMPRPFGYVNASYLRHAADKMRAIKSSSYEQLNLHRVTNVLDAGCGPGIDTVAIAEKIHDGAVVVGVDIDEQMLHEADEFAAHRGVQAKVRHILADVYDLPFEDAHFDACRAERLFQNIPASHDAHLVLNELMRVLKPGGRIVLVDTDYGSASVDFEDSALEAKMMHYCATRLRPNGLAARGFYKMLRDAHCIEIEIQPHVLVFTSLDDAPFGRYLADAALSDGYIRPAEATRWVDALDRLDQEQGFFATINIIIAAGTKP